MFLLDTDHLIIFQRRSEPELTRLVDRMKQYERRDFAISIISFHEQLLGANSYISMAKDKMAVVKGYQMMEQSLNDFSHFLVLPFDEYAAVEFDRQRTERVRIGTMDLRIASVAVSQRLILLTRNQVDFSQVKDLTYEDWTRA